MRQPSRRSCFSLIELLVVIAIIAILVTLLMAAVQKAREAANRIRCQNNQKQLALGLHEYHDAVGNFPLGNTNLIGTDNGGEPDRRNWAITAILPYVEQEGLYDSIQSYLATGGANIVYFPQNKTVMPVFMCLSDPASPKTLTGGPGSTNQQGFHTNYAACAGSGPFNTASGAYGGDNLDGIFYVLSTTRIEEITDGTSNTLLLSELILSPDLNTHDVRGRLYNPAEQGGVLFSTNYPPNTSVSDRLEWCQSIPKAPCISGTSSINISARSYHTGGVNVALADGSVRFVSENVDPTVWKALGSRAGGEPSKEY